MGKQLIEKKSFSIPQADLMPSQYEQWLLWKTKPVVFISEHNVTWYEISLWIPFGLETIALTVLAVSPSKPLLHSQPTWWGREMYKHCSAISKTLVCYQHAFG